MTQPTDRPGINELTSDQLDRLYAELDEARMWARHGYEIGQRSCTWSDYGVAPAWLTSPAVLDQHGQTPA